MEILDQLLEKLKGRAVYKNRRLNRIQASPIYGRLAARVTG